VSLGNDTTLCSGNPIYLKTGASFATSYLWSDNSTNTSLTITATGQYRVTVANANCSKKDTVNITVAGNAPTASFSSTSTCLGKATGFVDLSTPPSGDILTVWDWDFGDTFLSTAQNPSHTYADTGSYTVKLSVTTDAGCSHQISKIVKVNSNPIAGFSTQNSCIGVPYQFIDTSTTTPPNFLSSWLWNFGDGNTSNTVNPIHTYSVASTYSVSLTVTSSNGCIDSVSNAINIVASAPLPLKTTLLTPLNKSIITGNTIFFSWDSVNSVKYELIVSSDKNFSNIILDTFLINNSITTYTSTFNVDSLYWKVLAYNLCNNYSNSSVFIFSIFNPIVLPDLSLWLSADSVGLASGKVSDWYDRSINNITLTQVNNNKRPVYKVTNPEMNGHSCVNFDGIDDYLKGIFNSTLSNDSITLFLIQKTISSSNFSGSLVFTNNINTTDNSTSDNLIALLDINSTVNAFRNSNSVLYNNSHIYKPTIYQITTDGTKLKTYLNSAFTGTMNSSGSFLFDQVTVGSRWSGGSTNPMNCDVYEIILYNRLLAPSEQNQVIKYLRYKYAPPVNLGLDITIPYGLCDTTLDAGVRFTNFVWSTGATTQTITVSKTGSYWVTVKDVFGFTSRDTILINSPGINIPAGSTVLCSGSTKTWNTLFSKQGYTFQWQNNSIDSLFTITNAGKYWVKITDSLGCYKYSDTITITVDNFSVIAALGNDTTFCSGNSIYLKSGVGQATSYLWNDNSTNDSLTITTTGQYRLTVSNVNGCSKTDTINITIAGNAPTANFSNTTTCFGNATNFTDLSIPPGGNTITKWLWNFGEPSSGVKNTSSLQNPTHIYASTGSYSVKLIVTTNAGCGKEINKIISVYPNPLGNFTTTNLCNNEVTKFAGTATTYGYSITQWAWDFGEPSSGTNNISTLQNSSHLYLTNGNYTAQLIIQNTQGCKDTVSKNITIKPLPVTDFNYSLACRNSAVQFTDKSILPPSTTVQSSTWDFGDNGTSSLLHPKHTFSNGVNYTVSHIIIASNGCKDTVVKTLSVYPE
ncbi:MAG: PKD domain-containing protein, partial [Bacteroidetes bacterium]|nr:PKD domain-containing protein [Bacteroidota bacterium]